MNFDTDKQNNARMWRSLTIAMVLLVAFFWTPLACLVWRALS